MSKVKYSDVLLMSIIFMLHIYSTFNESNANLTSGALIRDLWVDDLTKGLEMSYPPLAFGKLLR